MHRRHFLLLPAVLGAPRVPDALLVGDSLAYQLASRLHREARRRGRVILADGRGATSVRQWRKNGWFRQDLAGCHAPLVLVCLGTNCTQAERLTITLDVGSLAGMASGRRLVWLLPPTLRYSTEYIRSAVKRLEIEAFDVGKLPMEWDSRKRVQDVHPTSRGHEIWAERLADYLGWQRAA